MSEPFVLPPYPYDRLSELIAAAEASPSATDGVGAVDLSIGTPCDPPPPAVVAALATSHAERGYPPSIGTAAFRGAAARWVGRRFGVALEASQVAACVGTKELVAGLPHWLHLRDPEHDTVLYPAVSYPSYAMGASLAGCRAVPVPADAAGHMALDAISDGDAARALCLWINSPANPTGALDDLDAVAAWGRSRGVPVLSDECYAEFTWADAPRTVLSSGTDGVLAVHSLSKRSNLAGVRAGFYAGDAELVRYLSEIRKHAGLMLPGPTQAAASVAFDDDAHVVEQRSRYRRRLEWLSDALGRAGLDAPLPDGGFYLWVRAPGGDAWGLARRLATEVGMIVSPGEFYGDAAPGHVRIAVVRPDEEIQRLVERLAAVDW